MGNRKLWFATILLAGTLGVLYAGWSPRAGDPDGAALVAGVDVQHSKILHIIATRDTRGGGGEHSREHHELWYDVESGDTVHEVTDDEGGLIVRTAVVGLVKETQSGGGALPSREVAPDSKASMRQTANELLLYRRWMADKALAAEVLANQQTVQDGGREVLRVGGPDFAREMELEQFDAWFDPVTLLPLRSEVSDARRTQSEEWTYQLIEGLSSAPPNVFRLSESSGVGTSAQYYAIDDAMRFNEYPVYYLGETFANLPVFGIVNKDFGGGDRMFQVSYAERRFEAGVHTGRSITVETRPSSLSAAGLGDVQPAADNLSQQGPRVERRDDLVIPGSGAFELEVDGSRVRIMGITESELSQLMGQVRQLNPALRR